MLNYQRLNPEIPSACLKMVYTHVYSHNAVNHYIHIIHVCDL